MRESWMVKHRQPLMIYGTWLATRLIILLQICALPVMDGDIRIYFTYSQNILKGLLPYRDFVMEYPPGVIPFLLLPKLAAPGVFAYRQYFGLEMMAFDLLGLILIKTLSRRVGASEKGQFLARMFYLILPALIFEVAYQRFDLIPAVLVLLALYLFDRGRSGTAGFVLGLAFSVKLYPVVVVPVMLIYGWRRGTLSRDLQGGLPGFGIGAAITWLPLLSAAGAKFWVFLTYHAQRGIQIESFYTCLLMAAHWLGLPVKVSFGFGSWNLETGLSPVLARLSPAVMLGLMGLVLVMAMAGATGLTGPDPSWLYRQALLMIMAFVLGGKVFSPQYLLWMAPLAVLAVNGDSADRKRIWGLFGMATLVTLIVFPLKYHSLLLLETPIWLLLMARNGLLAVLFYFLLKKGKAKRAVRNTRET